MLPLIRRASVSVLLALAACGNDGGTTGGGPQRRIALKGEVCAWLCDDHAVLGRDTGDFTGMACASEARIRLYPPEAALVGATPLVERCVSLSASSLGDLFNVTAGLSGAPPSQGMPVVLPSLSVLGPVIAEIALYAPGGAPCPADAPLVALGRSPVTDLSRAEVSTISVPLGCHASCATSEARQLQLRIESIDARIDESMGFDELELGELYSYEELVTVGGVCGPGLLDGEGPIGFRAYESTRGPTGFAVRYGIDSGPYGGCIALRARRAGVTSYTCLDGPETASPLAVVPPAARLAALAALRGEPDTMPTHGTLLIQTVDATGAAVDSTAISAPAGAVPIVIAPDWSLDSFSPFSVFAGMTVIADAPPGEYSALAVGRQPVGFLAGGAQPGTITIRRVRVP